MDEAQITPDIPQTPSRLEQLANRPEYKSSTVVAKMRKQTGKPYAFCTDVDGTWIKHLDLPQDQSSLSPQDLETKQEELDGLNEKYLDATKRNKMFLDKKGVPIIAVTGRDSQDLIELRERMGDVADFDILIGSQGGEIFVRQQDGTYVRDEVHHGLTEQFDKDNIHLACKDFMTNLPNKLSFMQRDTDENIALYTTDPDAKQHGLTTIDRPLPDKVLCNFSGNQQEAEKLKQDLEDYLSSRGFTQNSVVIVGTGGRMDLWDVEIVPMDKLKAIEYLTDAIGMDAVVAGDGGNDLAMIRYGANAGIVAGGSQPYLQNEIAAHPVIKQTRHFTKLLVRNPNGTESPRVFHLPSSQSRDNEGPASILDVEKIYHGLMLLRSFSHNNRSSRRPLS
jgi:hydroxymethylpyrimidine pyrophosphatase-like HAD family hydrolase